MEKYKSCSSHHQPVMNLTQPLSNTINFRNVTWDTFQQYTHTHTTNDCPATTERKRPRILSLGSLKAKDVKRIRKTTKSTVLKVDLTGSGGTGTFDRFFFVCVQIEYRYINIQVDQYSDIYIYIYIYIYI